MSEIWVISDTHFGHQNIIDYCDRPFKTAYLMNEAIRDNWNSTVKPNDKVYHLGDVYMGYNQKESIVHFLKSLHGKKRLILGNHDNGKDKALQDCFQKIGMWRMFPEFGLLLTHVPVHESALERHERNTEVFHLHNVHGHIHEKPAPSPLHRNVSVEQINYRPINLEELRVK
jgi:calcineurin-like phosphoesterase family protein